MRTKISPIVQRLATAPILLEMTLLKLHIPNSRPVSVRRRKRAILVFFLLALCFPLIGGGQGWAFNLFGEKTVEVTFTYPHTARKVCLAGDFNAWSPDAHCLKKERGIWTIRLKLKPGRYAYAFVLNDGKWTPDPGAMLLEDDGFGRKNSILLVE